VWSAANKQLEEGEYGDYVDEMSAVVDEVVFTSPTTAAVRFRLSEPDQQIPQATPIGEAVLVDGEWRVAIATTCELVSMASVTCDMTL
jgi:hypothetical protein